MSGFGVQILLIIGFGRFDFFVAQREIRKKVRPSLLNMEGAIGRNIVLKGI